ncbi:hypothetical protein [Angustibacter luteus]|uniref:Uncharacterized protein n=1 Tax=Angustibacter luteus TaxID=658456 RepID=A0ABW1JGC9_9ACTN
MSAPGLIALIGNLLATVAILPHLVQAIRERRPSGSPYGWALGAATAALWLSYGWVTSTPEIGAPGYVTFPVSVVLGVWAWREQRTAAAAAAVAQDVLDLDELDRLVLDDAARPEALAAA